VTPIAADLSKEAWGWQGGEKFASRKVSLQLKQKIIIKRSRKIGILGFIRERVRGEESHRIVNR